MALSDLTYDTTVQIRATDLNISISNIRIIDVEQWLKARNLECITDYRYLGCVDRVDTFSFSDPEIAMLFKLTWAQ